MAGSRAGGLKAAETIRKKNPNFFCENGRIGGLAKNPKKGFGSNKELAREMAKRIKRKRASK